MEEDVKGSGVLRSYFMLPWENVSQYSGANFTEVYTVGVLKPVYALSAKRRMERP